MMVCYTEKDFDPKYQEEIKLKQALRFLKEYCDNHVDCKECYIASRKYPYEACPCATLVNMEIMDEIGIEVLPDCARCELAGCNLCDLNDCPRGLSECVPSSCLYYTEEWT